MRLVAGTTAIAFLGALTGGCAHEERVAWPLSAAEVQRINGAIDDSGWFRVNYVRPETATALAPIARPTWIRSADADTITFRTVGDGTEQLPANLLTGVTVKDRGRGALVGTGIAVGAVAVELGIWYAFRRYWDQEGSCSLEAGHGGVVDDVCTGRIAIELGASTLLIGAIFGYFTAGRRTFHFAGSSSPTFF